MAATFKLLIVLSVFLFIHSCKSHNLTMGTDANAQLVYFEKVELNGFPLFTRNKNVFFNGNNTIRGIFAIDNLDSEATVKVTAGGVGFTFTNIKIKSERGSGLDYIVRIFV